MSVESIEDVCPFCESPYNIEGRCDCEYDEWSENESFASETEEGSQ